MGKPPPLFIDFPPPWPESQVEKIINLLQNVRQVQQNLLESLLEKNRTCEYLQKFSRDDKLDAKTFKRLLPLVKYEDIEDDIQRMVEGKDGPNILCCDEIVHFNHSGGTSSGKLKMLPVSTSAQETFVDYFSTIEAWFRKTSLFQQTPRDGLGMKIMFCGSQFITPSGLELAQVSTFHTKGPLSVYRHSPSCFTSPADVVLCRDFQQSMYCQLLCGLLNRTRVVTMTSVLAPILATTLTFLKDTWEELCSDIETGNLSNRIQDESARRAMLQILRTPDPELAGFIRSACMEESWAGILTRVWPNLRYISCVCTGTLLHYVDHFGFYTDNKVPVVSLLYGASEGFMAFNPHPEAHPRDVTYVFSPQMGYFEFRNVKDSSVVELADVKEGEEYEFICTNLSGLWRYRMGDIVKCVGYYHTSPEFRFMGRDNSLISIGNESIHEYDVTAAVESAARAHLFPGARLVGYTSTVNLKTLPAHYVLFWELEITPDGVQDQRGSEFEEQKVDHHTKIYEECCLAIENAFDEKYRKDRRVGSIGPLELILLKAGTFCQLEQKAQAVGVSNQMKPTRIYRPDHPALQTFFAAAQGSFRSALLPKPPSSASSFTPWLAIA